VLAAFTDCSGATQLACNDDTFGRESQIQVAGMAAGQSIVLAVEGFSSNEGAFQLHAGPGGATELGCRDGVDNDSDFSLDCDDADCVADPGCMESACADGLDDDGDGALDCGDTDCAADAACVPSCPAEVVAASPALVTGNTAGQPNYYDATCGFDPGVSDTTVEFTAPSAGDYAFVLTPTGTDYDAVLSVIDGCGGAELGCDDVVSNGGEVVIVTMAAGQTAVAVVDGWTGSAVGNFELSIDVVATNESDCADSLDEDFDGATDCADSDCTGDAACLAVCQEYVLSNVLPSQAVGTTVGATNDFTPACGYSPTAPDHSFEFTAPAAGLYTFDTGGSLYDTILHVTDGCFGASLACNDDAAGFGVQSQVQVNLAAGQTVFVVVDGYSDRSGDYVLNAY
jgi:hypothetical protein